MYIITPHYLLGQQMKILEEEKFLIKECDSEISLNEK